VKKFFAQLRPLERRIAIGMLVVVILVLNYVYIWPHFYDWSRLRERLDAAQREIARDQAAIADLPKYQALVKTFESEGVFVAPEDQSINFLRTIQSQSSASGVSTVNMSRSVTQTNGFFVELSQNINVNGDDKALVDFLYKLGSSASMIRVRDLELQPDGTHLRLNASIQLIASYQKNAPPALKQATAK
jgi:Tfp pilus assembly protein PilO